MADFLARRFCNHTCKGLAFRLPNGPKLGGLPHRGRKIARRKKERDICEKCGATTRLEIHHRDGDATNNDLSNLAVLCMLCHRKEHKTELCSIPGCGGKFSGLGYCNKHYRRFKKYGDPLIVQKNRHSLPQRVDS